VNRINHTSHQHPATPAGRKACRKATRTAEAAKVERKEREARFDADMDRIDASKMGKAPQDWSDEAKAATTWVDAFPGQLAPLSDEAMGLLVEPEAPFAKRAIVINFLLKDGKRCSVTFDRYGMNSELYRTALAYRWSAKRTVAQACSEAISAVGQQHGFDNIDTYTVTETD
jgi:hypothetical protein